MHMQCMKNIAVYTNVRKQIGLVSFLCLTSYKWMQA